MWWLETFLDMVLQEGNPKLLKREDAGKKTKWGLAGYSNFDYHLNEK